VWADRGLDIQRGIPVLQRKHSDVLAQSVFNINSGIENLINIYEDRPD
jgi:hypothetical protein